jgi:hypothetical protein
MIFVNFHRREAEHTRGREADMKWGFTDMGRRSSSHHSKPVMIIATSEPSKKKTERREAMCATDLAQVQTVTSSYSKCPSSSNQYTSWSMHNKMY